MNGAIKLIAACAWLVILGATGAWWSDSPTRSIRGPNAGAPVTWHGANPSTGPSSLRSGEYYFDDCMVNRSYLSLVTTGTAWTAFASGSSTVTGVGNGLCRMGTGTGATNGYNIMYGYNTAWGAYSRARLRFGFYLSALSTGTDTYTVWLGAFQSVGVGPQSNPAMVLRYTDSVNSGKFQLCGGANLGTCVDTGVTVAASTYYVVDMTLVNTTTSTGAGSQPVVWAIYTSGNQTATASGTANVGSVSYPGDGSGATGAAAVQINKSVGTTNVDLWVDFVEFSSTYK